MCCCAGGGEVLIVEKVWVEGSVGGGLFCCGRMANCVSGVR